mmetsp:Transcript_31491/g.70772  ORF Transcript_31491/g.70772 Transcript_31491/m.70772 type:complete len:101 (-) Transcript_31491:192-494(-)
MTFRNQTKRSPCRPSLQAAKLGDWYWTEELLDQGANIGYKDPTTGNQPLHYAAMGKDSELAKLLLSRGADPSSKNAAGTTAQHYDTNLEWFQSEVLDWKK